MSYQQRNYTRVLAVTGAAVAIALCVIVSDRPAKSTEAPPQPSVAEINVQIEATPVVQYTAHKSHHKEMPVETPEATWPITVAYIDEEAVKVHDAVATEEPAASVLTNMADLQASYDLLKRVIVSEAGNQGMQGMCAVAQVIYDRTYRSKHDWNQDEGLSGVLTMRNQFASPYPWDLDDFEPTVSEAIDAVFIHGDLVFDEVVTYFYNPAYSTESGIKFMQAQKYVDTIKDHEFRTGWDEND